LAAKAAMFLVPVAMVLLSGVILGVGDCGGLSGILKFELFLHTPDTDASLIQKKKLIIMTAIYRKGC
jgi:hypothetical protein